MPSVAAAAILVRSPNCHPGSAEAAMVAAAHARLRHSPYVPLRNVQCSLFDGVLILWGRVPSYYLKQIAQSLVLGMPAVREVRNELRVCPSPKGDPQTPAGLGQ